MTDLVAVTAKTIAGTLVCCLRAEPREKFFSDARDVVAEVLRMVDEEERRELGYDAD